MVRRENLAVFEGSGISETGEVTPTKIDVHACYINTYLNISETEEVTTTKIGVHAFHMSLYLHEFFEPILIN